MQDSKRTVIAEPRGLMTYNGQTAILEAAGLCGVCTDQHLNVVKAFGDTKGYLRNENFIFELGKLLPEDVSVIVQAATRQAPESNQRITLSEINFGDNGLQDEHSVNIIISPFFAGGTTARQLLILFTANKRKPKDKSLVKTGDIKQLTRQHLANLERELAEAKNNLEKAYALINSSNENIQSFNEELQSANEEMHSANEELQSVNEELQTVNREQQQTNAELRESNDDMNNYFRSNTNGQLFVDHDLVLKIFTGCDKAYQLKRERYRQAVDAYHHKYQAGNAHR